MNDGVGLRAWGLPVLVALAVLAVGGLALAQAHRHWADHSRVETAELGAAHATDLARRVAGAMAPAHLLAALVVHHGGVPPEFDAVARELIAAVPGGIVLQLAPDGVVRHIYPLQGQESALGHDVLRDDRRRAEARLAVDTGRLTIAGPFPLVQGGVGVVGRKPIYLPAGDDDDRPRFWGFAMVLVYLDELLGSTTLTSLPDQGLGYRLLHMNPDTGRWEGFAGAGPAPGPAAVEVPVPVPNQQWALQLSPLAEPRSPLILGSLTVLVVVAAAGLAYATYQHLRQPELLRRQVAERTRALATERALLDAIIDCVPDIVFCKDRDGRYLRCNRALVSTLGQEHARVLQSSEADLLDHDLARQLRRRDQDVLASGRPASYDFSVAVDDSGPRHFHTVKAPFRDPDGAIVGVVGVSRDISERKRREEEVWQLANFDSLTGLPNRRLFSDRLAAAVSQAQRRGSRLAVLFIDLDRFKRINDALGHSAGDQVLRAAARRLAAELRDADTVGRLSGDEFTAVLADVEDFAAVRAVVSRLLEVLAQPVDVNGSPVNLSCSIGVALYPRDGASPDALLVAADRAMYQAKEAGRDTWRGAAADGG